jgi:hypothetical protein
MGRYGEGEGVQQILRGETPQCLLSLPETSDF